MGFFGPGNLGGGFSQHSYNPLLSSLTTIFDANIGVTVATGVSNWVAAKGTAVAAQATGGNQPVYTAAGYNGQACITPDGVDDFLSVSSFSAASGSQYFCFVINSPFTGANKYLIDCQTGRLLLGSITGGQMGWSDGTGRNVAAPLTGLHVVEWVFHASGNGQIFVDGVQQGSTTTAEYAYTSKAIGGTVHLFSNFAGATNNFTGDVCWIGHQAGIPSNDTRIQLIQYLISRYGITPAYTLPSVGTSTVIVAMGDSLTSTGYWFNGIGGGFRINFAASGETVSNMNTYVQYKIGNVLLPSTVTAKYFVLLGGINDILNGGTDSSTYTDLSTLLAGSWLTGWIRVASTLIANGNSGVNAYVVALNTSLRAASFFEHLVDPAANAHYDPTINPTVTSDAAWYLNATHWTLAGASAVMTPLVQNVITPPVAGFILQEDGTYILQEDGTSKFNTET